MNPWVHHLTVTPLLVVPLVAGAFSFEDPAGPQFTEAERRLQRARGTGVVPMVRRAFEAGADSVVIPPGDYRFGKESWGNAGPIYPLEFRGMRRDAAHPFRIIAEGVTFWFDLPADQTPRAHFALGFADSSHVALEGATLDRDPRGNMEGRITQIDDVGNRIEIEAAEGTLVPTSFNGDLNQRLVPFNADGTFCTALYGLQRRPGQLRYRDVAQGTGPGRYWVNLDEKSELLKTNRDPGWRRAYGEAGTLQVGDGLSLVYTTTQAIGVIDCTGMRFIGIKIYISKGMAREFGGGGGHLWKGCYFGPRPVTCQWQGADGFLSGCMERGSTYDGITMLHTTDDVFNINGFWGYIEEAAGKTITLHRDHQMPARPGDWLNFFDGQTGQPVGVASVDGIDGQVLTLDRDAVPFAGSIAENPGRQCDGWVIRDSVFTDCYQRLLVQGGNGGVLRDCRFVRVGSCVRLHSTFFSKNEGGICRNISILNNTFEDVAIHTDGATLTVGFQPLNRKATAPLLTNLVVRDNTFIHPAKHAVEFDLVAGGEISGNTFHRGGPEPIRLANCTNVIVRENRAIPGPPASGPDSP
ncbi:MAG: right-handed parallel beta-helix repeat-containing protein [Verrucomicrobiae bacterium]|nr:right-handed parallel beta-helix repeat-containing protein [Verrucomicrobiae bacterium]